MPNENRRHLQLAPESEARRNRKRAVERHQLLESLGYPFEHAGLDERLVVTTSELLQETRENLR